tara:strand:+ start:587 stop:742 length:156 start_codon:yes stop_codon:yes gene_type:complete
MRFPVETVPLNANKGLIFVLTLIGFVLVMVLWAVVKDILRERKNNEQTKQI